MRNFDAGQSKTNAKYDLLVEKVMINLNCVLFPTEWQSLQDICYIIFFFFQIDNLSYELSVDHKVVDIDAYIPFKTIDDILHFCSKDDGLLDLKKAAFRRRIFACGKKDSVAVFAPSIIDQFFEGSPLLGTHKWPYKK